jgi:hypothetical protein
MSSYLLDIMCIAHKYPNMGWSWFPVDVAIHIYCKVLWEHKYRTYYQRICEHFLAPLYEFIFCTSPPCMTDKAITVIRRIGDWYLMEHGTYIRIYGAMKPPHLLPRFVPDKLVLQEVAYQTIIHGVGGMLYRSKKSIWPPLPLYIGNYFFENTKQAQEEVDIFLSYHFGEERFRRHDPKNIVKEHFHSMRLPYEYTTEFWEEEGVHQNSRTYDEVIFNRRGQPKGRIMQMKKLQERQPEKMQREMKLRDLPHLLLDSFRFHRRR